jgi:hypothetical protein
MVRLNIEIKIVKLLQQEQRLILDEFSHVQRCFLLFRHKGPQSISAQCKPVRGSDVRMVQRTDLRLSCSYFVVYL